MAAISWIFLIIIPISVALKCPKDCASYIGKAGTSACDCVETRYFKMEEDNNDVVEINCESGQKINYTTAMFSEFRPSNTDSFQIRFLSCSQPDIPFYNILSGFRVNFIRFSNEFEKMNLTAELFSDLPEIQHINLKRNQLELLPDGLFENMTSLQSIYLGENKLRSIPPNYFERNPNLRNLYLGNNKLKYLNDSIGRLTNLESLLLHENKLEYISPSVFHGMASLQTLDLQSNRLSVLDENLLQGVPNLEILNIYTNNLQNLSETFLNNNKKLTTLIMKDNPKLEQLPAQFLRNLTSLQELDLRNCGLISLPAGFLNGLKNLSKINLAKNKLETLEENLFSDTRNIYSVNLGSNNLTNISVSLLNGLLNLDEVDLSQNFITTLDEFYFRDLRRLRALDLSLNGLEHLSEFTFNSLQNLQYLDLSYNKLTDEFLFVLPQSIQIVKVNNNSLTSLHPNWIMLSNLKSIDMDYNDFSYVSYYDLQFVSNTVISLRYNNIRRIDFFGVEDSLSENLDDEMNPARIKLSYNPLDCDCRMYDFYSYLQLQKSKENLQLIIIDEPACSSPPKLYGSFVAGLKKEAFVCEEKCVSEKCQCYDFAYNNSVVVNCNDAGLNEWPNETAPIRTGVFLAAGNNLSILPNFTSPIWNSVTWIDLSDNQVQLSEDDVLPPVLRFMSLAGNGLTTLPDNFMELTRTSSNLTLLLSRNPWLCDCSHVEFKDWVLKTAFRIHDVTNLECSNSNGRLLDVEFCPLDDDDQSALIIGLSVTVASLSVILALGMFFYYKYNQEIKVWLFTRGMCMCILAQEDLDKDKIYDAFISFSEDDYNFVLQELMPKLENGEPAYKLCVHKRDWPGGEWIPHQITNSVENSRKIVIVLSKSFLNSVWGRLEFKTAYHQALKDRTNRIIIVVYGDLPPVEEMDAELKIYIKYNTYLKWNDPWFWDKLRYAMPHKRVQKSKKRKNKVSNNDHIEISVIGNNNKNKTHQNGGPPNLIRS